MDKNALTEKRRETVIGLLKGMNIKKIDGGGFDKEAVYDCMQQLCDLYEKNIDELQTAYETEILSLKERYQKYDENNELYISLIMEAKKSSNEIINQAKSEVESILADGKTQIAEQETKIQTMYEGLEAEKNAINNELEASRRAVEAEKAAMQAEIDAEKEKCKALKNKYIQQMNAMEDEFMEIKTNILRTAGKMDSLKSKLSDEDTISWNIMDIDEPVDFTEPGIELEDIIPYPEETPIVEEIPVELPADIPVEIEEDIAPAIEEYFAEDAPVELPENLIIEAAAEIPVGEPAAVLDFSDMGISEIDIPEINIPEIELPEIEAAAEIELPEIPVAAEAAPEPFPAAEGTFAFDGIFQEIAAADPAPAPVLEAAPSPFPAAAEDINLDEINFDDLEFSGLDTPAADAIEEISFEGLENLFKED